MARYLFSREWTYAFGSPEPQNESRCDLHLACLPPGQRLISKGELRETSAMSTSSSPETLALCRKMLCTRLGGGEHDTTLKKGLLHFHMDKGADSLTLNQYYLEECYRHDKFKETFKCKDGVYVPEKQPAQPASRPAPQPAPRPTPQPAPRPTPQPAPRPAPQPAPQPASRPASRPAPQQGLPYPPVDPRHASYDPNPNPGRSGRSALEELRNRKRKRTGMYGIRLVT